MLVQAIAILAALSYALSFILSKRSFQYSTLITITFISLLIQTITLFTILLTVTGIPAAPPFVLLRFAIAGILQAVVRQLTYLGIEKIGAARSGPIRASVPLWSAAIAIFFLGEQMTVAIAIGTLRVFGGILLISWRANESVKDFRRWYVVPYGWCSCRKDYHPHRRRRAPRRYGNPRRFASYLDFLPVVSLYTAEFGVLNRPVPGSGSSRYK